MAVAVSHATTATLPNDPSKEISSDAWNEEHSVDGLGDAAEKNVGTAAGTVAAGDHTHDDLAPLASPTFTGTVGGITKSMVGLGNVDNTTDAGKPVSTAQQTALDAKQATLVSGTNIKTINGDSVLGSGDLVVSGDGGSEAFPVGSVFIAVVSTDPATLLGYGTWSAFGAGRVLIGLDSGDAAFDTAEETGGAKTVTSTGTVSQPTFSGNALGTHAHGAGTLVPNAHSGTAVADHASHTHTYTQVPNHVHTITSQTATTGAATSYEHGALDTSSAETEATEVTGNPVGGVATGTTNGPSATLTHSVTQPATHTMSGTSEAVSGGTPAGTVSTPTYTGNATSVVQPYIVVYMWKRTE